jgi:Asp-tRNA(Asn)/Glu-tRNA(Gln) amidotransferase C subunit
MATSKEERVSELARLSGISVAVEEAAEVGDRLDSLLREMEKLGALDLTDVQPVSVFPEENSDGA